MMENFGVLEELRYLVTRPELSQVPEERLRPLLEAVKELTYKDNTYPVFQWAAFSAG